MLRIFALIGFSLFLNMFSMNAFASSSPKLVLVFDSNLHKMEGVPTFFSVEKFDVSLVDKIEAEISKRLVYTGNAKSEKDVERWAKNKLQTDPDLQRLMGMLEGAYRFTAPATQYGVSKVPAVVYVDDDKQYIVYGETNVRSALDKINAFRTTAHR